MNNSQSIYVLLKLLITVLVVGLFVGKILAYYYPLDSLPNEWMYAGIFVGIPTGIVISITIFLLLKINNHQSIQF
ncbi:hypothetical protein H2O64_03860 [Kordia sp. YSTF-M3]|uniref:Uncharacterized protein n=1 Tax=Kordia aestuariivivens TaxID=2759037 RepID=A0ABR7Q5E7_9FLAO|nr:hypothetical protein [Kordia aestuariivivens]MBC8753790.1 hypothetical protein [Kordia aestuariivivens]